jgi:hypothetical protein
MGVASSWNEPVQKNVICLTQKVMTHVWDKLFFFSSITMYNMWVYCDIYYINLTKFDIIR